MGGNQFDADKAINEHCSCFFHYIYCPGAPRDLSFIIQANNAPTLGMTQRLDDIKSELKLGWICCNPRKVRGMSLLFIGSATHAEQGMVALRGLYLNGKGRRLPLLMGEALQKGYEITHVCIHLSIPLPEPGLVLLYRHLLVVIEATLSFVLSSIVSKRKGYEIRLSYV